MSDYILSQAADGDINDIYLYSYEQFGEAKADACLLSLDETLKRLAVSPRLGKPIDYLRTGYRRYEHVSHSVFYKSVESGILIVRVLHNHMDAAKHL